MGHHGPGGGTPLLLAAGHLVGVLVQAVLNAQQPGHLLHPAGNLPRGGLHNGQGQGNIFKGGQGVQQVAVLKNEAQPLPAEAGELLSPQPGKLPPVDDDGARGGPVDGGHTVEQGGLAGARGTHDPHKFSRLQRQGHPVQRPGGRAPPAIDPGEVANL